jgi:hypothetical protein
MLKITLISEKIWLPNPVQDGAHKHSVCWSWFTHRTIISCNHPKSQILQIINQNSLTPQHHLALGKKNIAFWLHQCRAQVCWLTSSWRLFSCGTRRGNRVHWTHGRSSLLCKQYRYNSRLRIIPQFERHPILVTLWYLVSETNTLNESKHKTVAQQHTTTIWSEWIQKAPLLSFL